MMHRLISWKRGVVDPQTNDVAAPFLFRGEAYGYDMMHRLITWKRGVVDPQTNDVAAPAVGQAWLDAMVSKRPSIASCCRGRTLRP